MALVESLDLNASSSDASGLAMFKLEEFFDDFDELDFERETGDVPCTEDDILCAGDD